MDTLGDYSSMELKSKFSKGDIVIVFGNRICQIDEVSFAPHGVYYQVTIDEEFYGGAIRLPERSLDSLPTVMQRLYRL